MKILLAVDGSAYTRRMLPYVAAHDEWLGPRHDYLVATVVLPVPAYARGFLEAPMLEGFYAEAAQEVLRPLERFVAQQGWRVETCMRVGEPAPTLAALAEEARCGLIVMGTHGHGALANAVLGSVASGVLARSQRPVLLVP